MGDCQLKIIVSKEVVPPPSSDEFIVKKYASDSSLRDVRDDAFASLESISVWDVTLYPPKDITGWIFDEFPDKTGPKSKTLYDANCFPSAVWQILPRNAQPEPRSVHEDAQYNLQNEATISKKTVELVDQPKDLKPSQVLQGVTQRFSGELEDAQAAHSIRLQNIRERHAKEAARHAKLEGQIQKLQAIKSGTSEQVRKMLIKSRCSGAKSLKMQDRIYLHVAVIRGESVTENFRYFSRQDTVARIVQTLASDIKSPQEAELLICTADKTYRRLPITFRVYELIEKYWLKEVDSIVIRYFTPPADMPTRSVLDDAEMEETDPEKVSIQNNNHRKLSAESQEQSIPDPQYMDTTGSSLSPILIDRFDSAIASIDSRSKKKSSTSTKVRQMLMKSRAKGDAKRSRMEDRFFLELIVLEGQTASGSFIFMSRLDSMDRLLKEHDLLDCPVYAASGDGTYSEVDKEPTLESLEASKVLQCFGRLIVLRKEK